MINKNMEGLMSVTSINYLKFIGGDKIFGDVLVVGGGISGLQASLDLANSGFKVYLVEKEPSIGGHMAQLDKTFPTNECSI